MLASATFDPGSWALQGAVKIDDFAASQSDWFDCDLRTAAGAQLFRATGRTGTDAGPAYTQTLPLAAATFSVTTQVTLSCSHTSALTQPAAASNVTVKATRVGTLSTA